MDPEEKALCDELDRLRAVERKDILRKEIDALRKKHPDAEKTSDLNQALSDAGIQVTDVQKQ